MLALLIVYLIPVFLLRKNGIAVIFVATAVIGNRICLL